jgi:hypothetical protein
MVAAWRTRFMRDYSYRDTSIHVIYSTRHAGISRNVCDQWNARSNIRSNQAKQLYII